MSQRESFQCSSCGHTGPQQVVFSLGDLPLGNTLLNKDQLLQSEAIYPLDLAFCEICALLQIRDAIPPHKLIDEHLYFTPSSPSLFEHSRKIAEHLIESRRLSSDNLVIEVGSNDGALLRCFQRRSIAVLGIEPVAQRAQVAKDVHGIPTLVEYFNEILARQLKVSGKRADIVIANDVLELVTDLNDFVKGIRVLLNEGGIVVLEVPYVKDMVEGCRFDTISHDRLSWFSLASLDHLFRKHGLFVHDVKHLNFFRGGTLQLFASSSGSATQSRMVTSMLQEESRSGLNSPDFYRAFAQRVISARELLCNFLRELKNKRQTHLAAYGAGIKASILLNFSKLGKELIDFVVDINRYKQERFMPGVHLPIYSPQKLLDEMPDYVLVLSLDFVDEVLNQQAEFRKRGGRFIIPLPELEIL